MSSTALLTPCVASCLLWMATANFVDVVAARGRCLGSFAMRWCPRRRSAWISSARTRLPGGIQKGAVQHALLQQKGKQQWRQVQVQFFYVAVPSIRQLHHVRFLGQHLFYSLPTYADDADDDNRTSIPISELPDDPIACRTRNRAQPLATAVAAAPTAGLETVSAVSEPVPATVISESIYFLAPFRGFHVPSAPPDGSYLVAPGVPVLYADGCATSAAVAGAEQASIRKRLAVAGSDAPNTLRARHSGPGAVDTDAMGEWYEAHIIDEKYNVKKDQVPHLSDGLLNICNSHQRLNCVRLLKCACVQLAKAQMLGTVAVLCMQA